VTQFKKSKSGGVGPYKGGGLNKSKNEREGGDWGGVLSFSKGVGGRSRDHGGIKRGVNTASAKKDPGQRGGEKSGRRKRSDPYTGVQKSRKKGFHERPSGNETKKIKEESTRSGQKKKRKKCGEKGKPKRCQK